MPDSSPRSEPRTDPQLIAACLAQDESAWRELIARYTPLTLSIARRNGLDLEAAEEVAQETFTQLVRSLPALRNLDGLPKWLITTSFRYTLRAKRKRSLSLTPERQHLACVEPEDVSRWEQRHCINEALRHMGGRCEELLLALYANSDRPNYDLIAQQLDMPRGSIGPTRARCLKKLLQAMDDSNNHNVIENQQSALSKSDSVTHHSRGIDGV